MIEDFTNLGGTSEARPARRQETLSELLAKYVSTDPYVAQVAEARSRREEMMNKLRGYYEKEAADQEAAVPSKAEQYFRLAQAFADPGKTGSFAEGAGRAFGVSADIEKEKRLARRESMLGRRKADVEIAKLEADAASGDLEAAQKLSELGLRTRTEVASKLYEKMGGTKPESTAGKQAQDEGLTPGTPEFQRRVREIAAQSPEAAQARIDIARGQADIASQRAELERTRAEREAQTFSTPELNLLVESEDSMRASEKSVPLLKRALELNPLTYDSDAASQALRATAEKSTPSNPTLLASKEQETIMMSQLLGILRQAFGANPTEGERKILLDVEGAIGQPKKIREGVIKRALEAAETRKANAADRIRRIRAGEYRYRQTPGAQ